jgi:hypothetical protein
MTRQLDVEKRREWEERFERFRASGLTVARFCASEPVSKNTFYYWAKRIGMRSTRARSAARDGASEQHREPVRHTHVSAVAAHTGLVLFRLGAAVEVSVPANCLNAIRCLVHCAQHSPAERSAAFHEVVVGTR